MKPVGKGIEYEVKGGYLHLKIKLNQDFGPSKSRKTKIVATTAGNPDIDDTGTKLNLTLYR